MYLFKDKYYIVQKDKDVNKKCLLKKYNFLTQRFMIENTMLFTDIR